MDGGVHFRVWAPAHEHASVVIDGKAYELTAEPGGYFSGLVRGAGVGTRYRIRAGDGDWPDPASRFQPDGPHGDSEVIDPAFAWREWQGIDPESAVIYELHAGTFTREGTYAAAIPHLATLADTGITVIELMPVHEFPGTFGWGYDGVGLFAPYHHYGRPEDLRAFVAAAHAHALGVILDVVYNHFGPDGNYLTKFTPRYFTDRYDNDWGDAINFDGDGSCGVRELFVENAAYWIDEFGFDGLRLDATQSIFDDSDVHIVQEVTAAARAAGNGRRIYVVGENEPQDVMLLRDCGLDALWNDDFHHAARVAATGHHEAYYTDYRGRAQEFVSMARLGFLYQGQYYTWQKNRRGTPSGGFSPDRFICYLQNHDQIANSATGERLQQLTSRGKVRALTALLLLGPQTPMLFQGQEFGASSPFLYFADHNPELARLVRSGRLEFLEQFPSIRGLDVAAPEDRRTFERCKLDHEDRDADLERLHRELLRLRRQIGGALEHGAVFGDHCFVLRWPDHLLIVNLGSELALDVAAEPALAPPDGADRWSVLWHSEEDARIDETCWQMAAESAVLLGRDTFGRPQNSGRP